MKVYSVGIVGERNYQAAIRATSPGERAFVCLEDGNPYDDLALRVENAAGETIGYIAKSSWLRDAIHDEGRGCAATIKSVGRAANGQDFGVVLDVTLTDDDLPVRYYGRAGASDAAPARSAAAAAAPASTPWPTPKQIDYLAPLIAAAVIPVTCGCGAVYRIGLGGLTSGAVLDCPACKAPNTLPNEVFDALRAEFVSSAQATLARVHARILDAPSLLERLESAPRQRSELVSPVRSPKPSLWKRWFG
jgi:hypothetical protein